MNEPTLSERLEIAANDRQFPTDVEFSPEDTALAGLLMDASNTIDAQAELLKEAGSVLERSLQYVADSEADNVGFSNKALDVMTAGRAVLTKLEAMKDTDDFVYVVKYSLGDRGNIPVCRVVGHSAPYCYVEWPSAPGYGLQLRAVDYAATREEAVKLAESARAKKISSLKKQILKLEKMVFTPVTPEASK